MNELVVGVASAFWLGLLTSISPCPLATNIAAISFVGRHVGSPRKVLISGLLYTAGRTLTYLALGIVLVSSLLSAPHLSQFLLKNMNQILGPVLILVGMLLLGLISLTPSGTNVSDKMQKRVEALGVWGAFLLGIVFALSFCPISAGIFFVGLTAIAVQCESSVMVPGAYGIATALPTLLFAALIAIGAKRVGEAYNQLVPFEKWARRITGGLFVVVGIYFCLTYIFGVLS